MAKVKAPIYKDKNSHCCEDLMEKLLREIEGLNFECRANLPISKGNMRAGYGINKSNKDIACDAIISIVKEIKKIKGW